MRKTFLFLILLIPTLYAQDIGLTYNETTNVYDLYNEYNHFYVNASSGFQITNVIDEYWSQNYICINVYDDLGKHEKCENEMEFFWVSDTDNEFYSQLVGGSIFEIENYSFMFSITYFLYKNESEIKITPSLINTGPDVNLSISWKVDDIKIGNTYGDDYFSYINNDSVITYPLNNLTLNLNNSEMQESIYYLNEQTSGDWISTRWNYSNSNLSLYTEENNTVIYLNLNKESLLYGEEISTDIWWLDALCIWSCSLNAPSSPVTIQEGEQFDLNLSVSWSGVCSESKSHIQTRFNNGTWNDMNTSGTNLTSSPTKQQFLRNGWVYKFVVTGEDWWDTLYSVRGRCYFNLQNKYSSSQTVNVTEAEQMVCTALSASKTMTADENKCYYLTNNNIVFNCNGHTLYGNNDNYGLNTYGRNNSVIKNCHFENFTTTILVNKSDNTSIYNNTMSRNDIYAPLVKVNAYGVLVDNSRNTLIENVSQWNFTVDRGGISGGISGAGGYGIFVGLKQANNTIINNTRCENNSGDYHPGGEDPRINTNGYGIYAWLFPYDVRNLTINNFTSIGHTDGDIRFYQTTAAERVELSNIFASGSQNSITIYPSFNINNATIECDGMFRAISARDYAHYSNLSNIAISGSHQYGIYIHQADYVTVSNISISNTSGGYSLTLSGDSNNNVFRNVTINDSEKAIYMEGASNNFDNLVLDNYTYGIDFMAATDAVFSNSTFYDANINNFDYSLSTTGVRFINSTADWDNVTYEIGTSDFTVQWYARVNVTNSTGSLLEATVNDTDNQGNNPYFNYDSLTDWYLVNDTKYSNAGNTLFNLHNIIVNHSLYSTNLTTYNFSSRDNTVNITLYLLPDTIPPIITFVSPTNINTTINNSWSYVNITSNEPLSNAMLKFNGTWYVMTSLNSTSWYKNVTGLSDGNYTFNVTGNDTALNSNTTESLWVNVDTTGPIITFVSMTPDDSSIVEGTWVFVNITSNEKLSNSSLNFNGTIYYMSNSSQLNWYYNVTNLVDGWYKYNVTGVDLVGNNGSSENRTLTIESLCHLINTSETFTSNRYKCQNITSSNIVIDCQGYGVLKNTTNLLVNIHGFFAYEVQNITIKNCIIDGLNNGIILNKTGSNTQKIYNNTIQNINNSGVTGVIVHGIYWFAPAEPYYQQVDIQNNTIHNITANCTGASCSAYAYGIRGTLTSGVSWANPSIVFNNNIVNISGTSAEGLQLYSNLSTDNFYVYISNNSFENITTYGTSTSSEGTFYIRYENNTYRNVATAMYLREFRGSFIDGERIYNCGNGIVLPSGGHALQCNDGAYMENVVMENLTGTGVLVYEASPAAFACNMNNMSITNASTAIYIYSSGGKAHLISNSSIYRSQIYDFSTDSHGNIFLNTTFNRSMLRFGGTSNLTVKWYGRVNVTDITNSSLNATITIKNNFSTTVYTSYSNLTPWTIFNDTVYSSANSYSFNNHLISTNKTSYYNNNTLFNFSWRDLTANITMYSVTIPNITFVYPTYPNNTIVYEPINYTYINITSNESLINATLNFSGTIYQMFENTPMNWVINLTSIPFGSYYYSVTGSNQYLSNGTSEIRNITFSPYEEGSLLIFTNQTPTYNSNIYVYVDTQYVNFTNYILNASCLNPLNQTVILSLSNISSLYYDILNLQYEGNYTCQTSAVNQTYSLHNTTSFTVSCPSGYTPFNHICYIHLFLSFNLFTNQTYYDIGDTVLIWCNATRNSTINEIWVFSSSGSPYNMTYLLTKNMWYTYYPISQKQEYITSYSYSDTGQATGFGDIIITYNPSNATDSTWDQIYVGLTFIGLSVGMVVFIIIMIIIFVILAKMFISDKLHIRRPSGSFQTKETSTFNNRFANTMSSSMSGFSSLRNSGGILLQIFFIIISIFIIIAVLLITLYVLDVLNII